VAEATVNEWLGSIRSFTETIENMGMRPGIRLLSHGPGHNPEITKIVGVEEYYAIERVRFADETPIAIEREHFPPEIGSRLAAYDLSRVTLYSVLEENELRIPASATR
jgi:GntR family transcriptional regulator